MITHPQTLDVMVASNLFGDILTDLGAALSGSLGVAPGANLNPDARVPVDVRADPRLGAATSPARASPIRLAAIWAGALMLDHLGEPEASRAMVRAIEGVLAESRVRTPDLGGTATTDDMTAAVIAALASPAR